MKGAALLAALLWSVAANGPAAARQDAMRYERAVRVAGGAGQACAVLDAQIFPHAAPSLTDLRLFETQDAGAGDALHSGAVYEVPYAITVSEAANDETEAIYTTVADTTAVATVGRESVAKFKVPARVPVERVSFVLTPGFTGNFNRDVRVTALAEAADLTANNGEAEDIANGEDERAPLTEAVTGSILRVHTSEAGREIRTEQLSIPAVLGANLQRAAEAEVAIENGDDKPLPIAAVRLEMRERKMCFDAPADGRLTLYYGDPELPAPEYEYAREFVASRNPLVAELGPEVLNAAYRAPATQERPFAERHPELMWIALIIVAICALGVVALKTARNAGR